MYRSVTLVVLLSVVAVGCESRVASPTAPELQTVLETPRARRLVEGVQTLIASDRACILVTIDDTDSRNNVIRTIRGAGSILDLVEGRDPEPSDPSIFNRYVLKPSLLPAGHPEITVQGGVMINADVPAVVRNEYSQDTALWWTIAIGTGQNPTRAEMQQRLRNEAYINRLCTQYWQVVPGDTLTVAAAGQPGDLLSKFQPLP